MRTPAEHAQALRLVASTTLGLAQEIEADIVDQIIPAESTDAGSLLDDLDWALRRLRQVSGRLSEREKSKLEAAEYRLSVARSILSQREIASR